jgi:DNA-directed RNA polymerase subunit RPC12/RpoP
MSPTIEKKQKEIRETKCTCSACSNVWYYGKEEVSKNRGAKMNQVGKAMMCCGGCLPALLIPNREVVDLAKCPKCGSKAVTKEVVTHYV